MQQSFYGMIYFDAVSGFDVVDFASARAVLREPSAAEIHARVWHLHEHTLKWGNGTLRILV